MEKKKQQREFTLQTDKAKVFKGSQTAEVVSEASVVPDDVGGRFSSYSS